MQPNIMRWWKKYSLFIKGNRRWKKWGKYTSSTYYDRIINRLHHFGKNVFLVVWQQNVVFGGVNYKRRCTTIRKEYLKFGDLSGEWKTPKF